MMDNLHNIMSNVFTTSVSQTTTVINVIILTGIQHISMYKNVKKSLAVNIIRYTSYAKSDQLPDN